MPNKYQIWWQLVFCCKWRGGPYLIILDVVWHTGNNSLVMCHGVGIISTYSQVSRHGGGSKVASIFWMYSSYSRSPPTLFRFFFWTLGHFLLTTGAFCSFLRSWRVRLLYASRCTSSREIPLGKWPSSRELNLRNMGMWEWVKTCDSPFCGLNNPLANYIYILNVCVCM